MRSLIEKPDQENSPSNLAIIGRYILTPAIFSFLEKHEIGAGGEIQLTDAIQKLTDIQEVFAYEFEGKRYDVGEKKGFVETNIDFALLDEEIRDELMTYLRKITQFPERKTIKIKKKLPL